MLDFMVLAAPRSGTAWVSNWLTTDRSLCLHDPLFKWHYKDWDRLPFQREKLGVACTGIAVLNPNWARSYPCRKLVIHRPIGEINASLGKLGLPALGIEWDLALDAIDGYHVQWDLLTSPSKQAELVWDWLLGLPYDADRHLALAELNIQRDLNRISINRAAFDKSIGELQAA